MAIKTPAAGKETTPPLEEFEDPERMVAPPRRILSHAGGGTFKDLFEEDAGPTGSAPSALQALAPAWPPAPPYQAPAPPPWPPAPPSFSPPPEVTRVTAIVPPAQALSQPSVLTPAPAPQRRQRYDAPWRSPQPEAHQEEPAWSPAPAPQAWPPLGSSPPSFVNFAATEHHPATEQEENPGEIVAVGEGTRKMRIVRREKRILENVAGIDLKDKVERYEVATNDSGHITCFIITEAEISDFSFLAELPELDDLRFNQAIAVEKLNILSDIRKLRVLSFSSDQQEITIQDLAQLVPNLESLSINFNPINNLAGIENFTHLRDLNLAHTSVSDFRELEKLTDLEELNLSRTKIRDISGLAKLRKLRTLNLRGLNIDRNQLQVLWGFRESLRNLWLPDGKGRFGEEIREYLESLRPAVAAAARPLPGAQGGDDWSGITENTAERRLATSPPGTFDPAEDIEVVPGPQILAHVPDFYALPDAPTEFIPATTPSSIRSGTRRRLVLVLAGVVGAALITGVFYGFSRSLDSHAPGMIKVTSEPSKPPPSTMSPSATTQPIPPKAVNPAPPQPPPHEAEKSSQAFGTALPTPETNEPSPQETPPAPGVTEPSTQTQPRQPAEIAQQQAPQRPAVTERKEEPLEVTVTVSVETPGAAPDIECFARGCSVKFIGNSRWIERGKIIESTIEVYKDGRKKRWNVRIDITRVNKIEYSF